MDEVFEQLRCSTEGLTDAEGEVRIKICGPNKLEEKSVCFNDNLPSLAWVNTFACAGWYMI